MKPTLSDYIAAINRMDDADFTAKGLPKMDALNAEMKHDGFDAITSAERDAFANSAEADADVAEEQRGPFVITEAPMDPVPVRVAGKLIGEYRVGEEFMISAKGLEVLRNSSITFEKA